MSHTPSTPPPLPASQMADATGVDVGPVEVQPGLLVVPLLSWYNTHFDGDDPR